MIEKILLKDVASYNHTGVTLDNLKKINIIYGNNGSGKTTLSELIRNSNDFPSCSIDWQGNKKIATYVYNRNFVKENFLQGNPIKGIFTLGKDSVEAQAKISDLKEKINKHDEEISNRLALVEDKKRELSELDQKFKEACWKLMKKVEVDFNEMLKGVRNSKEKFMSKCIEESKSNKRELKSLEDIKSKKQSLYDRKEEFITKPSIIRFDSVLESDSIFSKRIIGKEDVDLAGLITSLQISDWVNQGVMITKKTDGICPFCQQTLPEFFEEKLNNYFDHTYESQVKELSDTSDRYIQHIWYIVSQIESTLKNENNTFIDHVKVHNLLTLIQSKVDENKLLIEQKKKEPSKSIKLAGISTFVDSTNEEIMKSNKKIDEFNRLIENSRLEKENLIRDMWRYIVEENRESSDDYNSKKAAIDKTVRGLEGAIAKKKQYKDGFEKELGIYQQQITNVEHSINQINSILKAFGFNNFKLASAPGEGNYQIVRENGEEVSETLSEGEQTLITFLYFYQLLKGSNDINEIVTKKVVVIDDPISSLDSTVLFMVSSLVRELMFDCKENRLDIKQLFILTHNIYFHKEVTFSQGKKNFSEGRYWILRKVNNVTTIQPYSNNPIKTSYEMLWKELRNPYNQNVVSIQNIMRRILENYFKFFGNMDINDFEKYFEMEQKIIYRSLLSWLHDGSHSINEDLYIESNGDAIDRYMEVFREIFLKTNHYAHYEMMMGDATESANIAHQDQAVHEGLGEIASGMKEAASTVPETI
ncbi:AAA family ATPase [Paenibacillus profundus]|uniref:Nuclease SbcCD subunit C n=1 Tax=Paenibacillus profundus TaxID=1173085 RepID=A0ABS8YNC4_9BACL|nr:AAA family ATPase [Paenibacillus profundus]MCE5171817.1 AAA family ATPase [Paenibacillus profundus]